MPQCQWPVTKAVLEDMIDPKNSLTTKTSPGISDNASSNFQNMKIKIFVFNALSLVSDSCSKNLLPSQFWISDLNCQSNTKHKLDIEKIIRTQLCRVEQRKQCPSAANFPLYNCTSSTETSPADSNASHSLFRNGKTTSKSIENWPLSNMQENTKLSILLS